MGGKSRGHFLRGHSCLRVFALIAALSLSLFSPLVKSEEKAASPSLSTQQLDKVDVVSERPTGEERNSTSSKIVIQRRDIERFGDSSLADVLRRVPGVSVAGTGSQPRDIRLRGMGNGYTQILINGEAAPQGFSLDSLSPDLIESIELVRAAGADSSAQSVAGTINIVLRRRPPSRDKRSFTLGTSILDERIAGTATGQFSGQSDNWTHVVTANATQDRNFWPSVKEILASGSSIGGQPLSQQTINSILSQSSILGLTPRISYSPSDDQRVSADGLLQTGRSTLTGREERTVRSGVSSARPLDIATISNEFNTLRGSTTMKTSISSQQVLELKLSATQFDRSSDGQLRGYDTTGTQLLYRTVSSQLTDSSLLTTGKYSRELASSVELAMGWDLQLTNRSEDRIQRETSAVGYPTENFDESYSARIRRVAGYGQAEISSNSLLASYLGLRWESVKTDTNGIGVLPASNDIAVFSPVAQARLSLREDRTRQLRVSIARTFRPPTAQELIPRRWVVNDNSPTSPNFQGNPNLLPELAWGIDVGIEESVKDGSSSVSLNAYAKQIDNTIVQQTSIVEGIWIATPVNDGRADAFGLEFEAKDNLRRLVGAAYPIEVRLGVNRNWSRLSAVPAPNNRLRDQPWLTVKIGADYSTGSLTVGAAFGVEKIGFIRLSQQQTLAVDDKRILDVYGTWTLKKGVKLRLAIDNVTTPDNYNVATYADTTLTQAQSLRTTTFQRYRVLLDMQI